MRSLVRNAVWLPKTSSNAEMNGMAGMMVSRAEADYGAADKQVNLEVTDTGGHPDYVGSLAKVAGTTFNQKASNGYMRGTTLGGHPAVESWNHVDRLGDISVLMSRRFIIHATGTDLDRIQTLRSLVETVAGSFQK